MKQLVDGNRNPKESRRLREIAPERYNHVAHLQALCEVGNFQTGGFVELRKINQ